jgi:hypothetical protein
LKVTRAREGATRKVSTYRVTPDDEQFKQLLDKIHERLVAERDLEKMSLAASPYKGNSNLAGLPRSNPMSSVVDREESPRFTVMNRSSEFSPRESERSTKVNRSNGDGHRTRLAINRDQEQETVGAQ